MMLSFKSVLDEYDESKLPLGFRNHARKEDLQVDNLPNGQIWKCMTRTSNG